MSVSRKIAVLLSLALLSAGLLSACGQNENHSTVTVFLVRHGRSVSNDAGLFSGQKDDTELSEDGKAQAAALGQALKNVKFDAAISSEMVRTNETAEIILGENACDPPEIDTEAGFNDIDLGALEGMKTEDAVAKYGTDLFGAADDEAFAPPAGGENMWQFVKRFGAAMDAVTGDPKNAGKTLLVTAHSSAAFWLQQTFPDQCGDSIDNCSVTVFQKDRAGYRLIIYNDTDYGNLPARLQREVFN